MNEKYTLQFPFTSAAGERIDVLQLRRLKVKDMRAARRASDTATVAGNGAAGEVVSLSAQ